MVKIKLIMQVIIHLWRSWQFKMKISCVYEVCFHVCRLPLRVPAVTESGGGSG